MHGVTKPFASLREDLLSWEWNRCREAALGAGVVPSFTSIYGAPAGGVAGRAKVMTNELVRLSSAVTQGRRDIPPPSRSADWRLFAGPANRLAHENAAEVMTVFVDRRDNTRGFLW